MFNKKNHQETNPENIFYHSIKKKGEEIMSPIVYALLAVFDRPLSLLPGSPLDMRVGLGAHVLV